ncbi:MAG: helix-turn-helix transcriptional regulator [Gemmatimonadales bacterium]
MSQPKTARWLDLLAFLLQHRFPVAREQIFAAVAGYREGEPSAIRQRFERDKKELKALGLEIETIEVRRQAGTEDGTGYRLKEAGVYLPYFELLAEPAAERPYRGLPRIALSADELAILDRATRRLAGHPDPALADAAAAARRKLEFDLPFPPEEVERVLAAPIPDEGRRALAVLQQATADRRAVRCRYYSISRDEESDRVIEPYGLLFYWSHWYCVGRSRERDALRVFRLDRMKSAEVLSGPEAAFEVPAGFEVRSFARRAPWELGEGEAAVVRVRLDFPEWIGLRNRGLGRITLTGAENEAAEVELEVRDQSAFLRWALTLGKRITVLSPPEVAEALGNVRRQVAALYQTPDE